MIGDGCFPAGTMIAVAGGECPVERLAPGQMLEGATGPVALRTITPHEAPPPGAAIRLAAGALGPGLPRRPLLLSPEQLVLVRDRALPDGVLVPAGALANGRTIERATRPDGVVWYALGCAAHALPLAEGLGCGTRRNPGESLAVRLLPPGPGVFALLRRLDRTPPQTAPEPAPEPAPMPMPTPRPVQPRLLLLADDQPIVAEPPADPLWRFTIPPGAVLLRLVSPPGRPDGGADPRRFGVAITALSLDGVPLALAGPAFGAGFHALEGAPPRQWRWTDGRATLALPPCPTARRLAVTINDWHRALHPDG